MVVRQVAQQESAVNLSGSSLGDTKIDGTASDGAGLRKKKQQEQSKDPAAKKEKEKQHLQKQVSSSAGMTTTGAQDSSVLTRESSSSQTIDSINFVEAFLASDILKQAAEEPDQDMAASSGFGAF